jgi:SAM-dependent methyltransferase
MPRALFAFLLAAFVLIPGRVQPLGAQLPRFSDEQARIADIEVPKLVGLLGLEPGMSIADVGAGFGAWTDRFSRWTGPSGHVYATDVAEEALAVLRDLVTRERLSNVTVAVGAADSTNLPVACCHAILLRNVFHLVTQPAAMIRSLAGSLKPGGRLAIVDFPPRSDTPAPAGVPPDRRGNGVPPEAVEREVGVLLRHITTVPNWSPKSVPDWVPPDMARPFVAVFEKTR